MRCLLNVIFTSALVHASTPKDLKGSSGIMLLQRPGLHFSHVDTGTAGERLPRQSTSDSEQPTLLQFGDAIETLSQLRPVLEREAFTVLETTQWSRWTPHHSKHKHGGVHAFLSSVVFFDWCLFASAIMVFLILHMLVLGRMEERGWHCAVLMIWITVGLVYNAVIWGRFGSNAGISWFAGYLLEFIFLVENIFIFHIVIQAFKTPVKLTRKALHIVVWAQIMFEMIFFMGLAAWLRSFKVLPYLLGVWLICCGFLAAQGEPTFEGEIMETSCCRTISGFLGDRLSPSYQKDGECVLRCVDGKMRVSLLGLVVAVLLFADFLLEIDVVLTKIEELPNPYIAFTSSALAAFSIPDLFFVSKGLLQRFKMLKYGIGFVLVLFGTQMLLSSIYILRPIVACCIIIGVLGLCILASVFQSLCCSPKRADDGSAGAALFQVGQDGAASSQVGQDGCKTSEVGQDAAASPQPEVGQDGCKTSEVAGAGNPQESLEYESDSKQTPTAKKEPAQCDSCLAGLNPNR